MPGDFTTVPLRYLGIDVATATTFFVIFSRFEYALKFTGYRLQGLRAKPSWDDFATAIADAFDAAIAPENVQFTEAAACSGGVPADVQAQVDDHLSWAPFQTCTGVRTAHNVLDALQQVRNNLFHGGKYFASQRDRDERLITASMIVLEACVQMDAEVRRAYFDIA